MASEDEASALRKMYQELKAEVEQLRLGVAAYEAERVLYIEALKGAQALICAALEGNKPKVEEPKPEAVEAPTTDPVEVDPTSDA